MQVAEVGINTIGRAFDWEHLEMYSECYESRELQIDTKLQDQYIVNIAAGQRD